MYNPCPSSSKYTFKVLIFNSFLESHKEMHKYFTKHADYLKIISHENDCYSMWKTKQLKHEKTKKFDEEQRHKLLMKIIEKEFKNKTKEEKDIE